MGGNDNPAKIGVMCGFVNNSTFLLYTSCTFLPATYVLIYGRPRPSVVSAPRPTVRDFLTITPAKSQNEFPLVGLRRFLAEEDGPTAVEYAIMLSLIVIVCISTISTVAQTPTRSSCVLPAR